jgi:hypothetical protein
MQKKNYIIIIFICLVNVTAIWYLRQSIRADGSDKGIILFWLFYPLLMLANLTLRFLIQKDNKQLKKFIIYILVLLTILFLPLLFTIY